MNHWKKNHSRFFTIGGFIIRLESDLNLSSIDFADKLKPFMVPQSDFVDVTIKHHFEKQILDPKVMGEPFIKSKAWYVYSQGDNWFYCGVRPNFDPERDQFWGAAVFNNAYTSAEIYNGPGASNNIKEKGFRTLSVVTDQIWLCPLLAQHDGIVIHSSAAVIDGHGVVFSGQSGAGKSTTLQIFETAKEAEGFNFEILCDDRNIIRKNPDEYRVYGTWSHGLIPIVSPSDAPLRGIFFLEQDDANYIERIPQKEAFRYFLYTLVESVTTVEWWNRELDVVANIIEEVPIYRMHFDKSGQIVSELRDLLSRQR